MKRPVAIVGFTFLFSQLLAAFAGFNVALSLSVLFLLLSILFLCFLRIGKYSWLTLVSISAAFSLGMFCVKMHSYITTVDALEGKQALVTARLVELPEQAFDRYYYIIETSKIDLHGVPQKVRLRLSSKNSLGIDPYDEFTVMLNFVKPLDRGRLFNSRISSRAKGITMYAHCVNFNEEIEVTGVQSRPLYYYALMSRQHTIDVIDSMLPLKQSALVKSVVLGDTSNLDAKLINDFRVTGTSHVFSVSGLHFAVVIQLILSVFLFLKIPKRFSAFLTILPVIGFMALVGFSPSVTRAGIMMIIYLLGLMLGKESDSLNSLGLAVLLLLLINPFGAGDIGLLLSVFATLGIIMVSPKIERVLSKPINKLPLFKGAALKLSNSIAVTLGATLTTLPVMLLAFEGFSNIAIIGNLLIVPPCMIMMIAGALAAVFNLMGPVAVIAYPFVFIAGVLANFIQWLAGLLSEIPFAYHSVSNDFTAIWIVGTALIFFVAIYLRRNTSLLRLASILSVIVLMSGIISHQLFMRGVTTISVLSVGEGKAVVLTREGHSAVIGCGGGFYSSIAAENVLKSRNINKIDLMILPSLDKQAASAAPALLAEFDVGTLIMPQKGRYLDHVETFSDNVSEKVIIDSFGVELWKDMKVEIIEQGGNFWVFISCRGTRVLVCPDKGDVLRFPANMLEVDLLICGPEIPANMARVDAKHVVISAEEERAALYALQMNARGFGSCFTTAYQDVTILTRGSGKLLVRSGN